MSNARKARRTAVKRNAVRAKEDGLAILEHLARLDEAITAKKGPEWVYSVVPDMDGPFMYWDGETAVLGPKARAAILDLRRLGGLDAIRTYRAFGT
jgi:hypothetical protein